jgi:hypothetical protein
MNARGQCKPRAPFNLRSLLAGWSLAILAAGCASTHGLKPAATMQSADSLAAERTLAEAPLREGEWPGRDWWTALGDPQLDELIREGLRDSPTLKVAAARTALPSHSRAAPTEARGAAGYGWPRMSPFHKIRL